MTHNRCDQSTDHDQPYFDLYVFMSFFYHNINVKENVFLELDLKKVLRDTLTRAAWQISVS